MTTHFGVPLADDQNSLKAGLRGLTLMEELILREKIPVTQGYRPGSGRRDWTQVG